MNLKRRAGHQSGFTIIEVLIVLAIAGLVVLIVFLAVPALQRNSRNDARKKDVGMLASFILEQISLTGQLPDSCNSTDSSCFVNDAALGFFTSPPFNIRYSRITAANNFGAPDNENVVRVFNYMKCTANYDWAADGYSTGGSGHLAGPTGATYKNFVILYYIETSNGVTPLCQEF